MIVKTDCSLPITRQIMLGMVTHDPHFSLLREEVRFGGKNSQKRSNAPEQTTFHLLHLQLLREYLDFEFSSLRVRYRFLNIFYLWLRYTLLNITYLII